MKDQEAINKVQKTNESNIQNQEIGTQQRLNISETLVNESIKSWNEKGAKADNTSAITVIFEPSTPIVSNNVIRASQDSPDDESFSENVGPVNNITQPTEAIPHPVDTSRTNIADMQTIANGDSTSSSTPILSKSNKTRRQRRKKYSYHKIPKELKKMRKDVRDLKIIIRKHNVLAKRFTMNQIQQCILEKLKEENGRLKNELIQFRIGVKKSTINRNRQRIKKLEKKNRNLKNDIIDLSILEGRPPSDNKCQEWSEEDISPAELLLL